jgi:hypothetical protein
LWFSACGEQICGMTKGNPVGCRIANSTKNITSYVRFNMKEKNMAPHAKRLLEIRRIKANGNLPLITKV